jgi:LVIVD repeat
MNKDLFRARLLPTVAVLALIAGGLVGVSAGPATAHPEACASGGKDTGYNQEEDEICFTQEQIDAMDDSGADLGVDEIAKSDNVFHLANVPKQEEFAAENAFGSDAAFTGNYAITGNYLGFSIYDIRNPLRPRLVSTTVCPGSQNDVSVSGNLLFTSTDSSRNKPECEGNVSQSATIKESWEGIRIFDISDKASPRYVGAVETDCGSHTHTTIPDRRRNRTIIYISSYSPNTTFPDCQPPHDKISVVEVPHRAPETARVIAEPVLFPDGGFPGIPGQTSATTGCHDITAYPAKGLAAGACMGQGVLFDIRDLTNPRLIDSVTDPNFAFWHSATFNNDATTVVFTDELGGGTGPTCNPTVGPNRGADAIYRIINTEVGKRLEFASYFKIPRDNANTENCVAHNGSLVPVPGRDIMVQAWYQGGISVWEFTNPARPRELAFFERGPLSTERLIGGGSWSAYWYNGLIYSSDLQKGLDVLFVADPALVLAGLINRMDSFNAQTQTPHRRG